MLRAAATPSSVLLFRCASPRIRYRRRQPWRIRANAWRWRSLAAGAVSAFLLEGEPWYEYQSSCSNDSCGRHDDERPAQRAEPEQHVSATAGGATAESGSDRSGRSFAVRGTTGAVQRTERGDVDLHVIAGRCSGYRRDRNDSHRNSGGKREQCTSERVGEHGSGARVDTGGDLRAGCGSIFGSSIFGSFTCGSGNITQLFIAGYVGAYPCKHQQDPRSVLNA